jgi:DNA-binding MarR family transcriptional regulator
MDVKLVTREYSSADRRRVFVRLTRGANKFWTSSPQLTKSSFGALGLA